MAFNSPDEEWNARQQLDLNDKLFTAVAEGHVEKVKQAIKDGADVNADRSKALRLASGMGQTSLVSILLHHKAAVTPLDNAALRAAVKGGHADVAAMLLGNGADPNASDGEAIIHAASHGQDKMVGLLLTYHADPQVSGGQALCQAAYNGYFDIVRNLVQQGADVFSMHGSALSLAQADKHAPIVEYLAQAMHEQRSFLHQFFDELELRDVPGLLRAVWQDVNGRDTAEPALIRALKMNELGHVLEKLQQAGDGLTAQDLHKLKDRDGRSFLHLAADRGQLKAIFHSAIWPNRFEEMAAEWEKLTPAQKRQGGMNADDFAHLVALKNQTDLKARAGQLNLKLKNNPKPPQG
jgi:hypothetical protein